MKGKEVLFSSKSDEWATPPEIFEALDREFGFNLDPCATEENHKCAKFYTSEEDGLKQPWGGTERSSIRLTQIYRNGFARLTRNHTAPTRSYAFLFQQGRTRATSTNTSSIVPRFAL